MRDFQKSKVLVAMSGGVDSSVSSYLLKEQGYEVIGITMQIWPDVREDAKSDRRCCSYQAALDARSVCFKLGISHYVLNFKDVFYEKVIEDFICEYSKGRTPNPCIRCNQFIKFDALLKKADELGANFVATGHYARVVFDKKEGKYLLKKGVDCQKDQSYVLYVLNQKTLARVLFPLGELTKDKVREIAQKVGLKVANKEESQEICFIDGYYGDFLKKKMPSLVKPGPIVDTKGNVLGMHKGIVFYTVGQRRGLGLSYSHPLYVLKIDGKNNTVVVGEEKDTYKKGLIASSVNWVKEKPFSKVLLVNAKIRYNDTEAPAEVTLLDGDKVKVTFKEKKRSIAPGQAVVFYKGDEVVGGGTIESAF